MDLLVMKTFKLTTMAAALAVFALGATPAFAAGVNGDTVIGTASATVANAVTLTQTQGIAFGTFVVVADGLTSLTASLDAQTAAITWPGAPANGGAPFGSTAGGAAKMFPTGVGGEQVGQYTIAGAALNSTMGVLINNDTPATASVPVCLAGVCGVAGQPEFTLTAFEAWDTAGAGGAAQVNIDALGAGAFNLGANLVTDALAADSRNGFSTALGTIAGAYADGAYSGTFDVSVVY